MCGIFGLAGDDRELGQTMARRIAHRGPDDEGIDVEAGAMVGNRRLSIIDLSPGGHQPMWWNGRSIGAVYNGELYNYRELRRELEAEGAHFASGSDTEVLLVGYARHGLSFFAKCRGMWACAFLHTAEQKFVLVRDYYGIKPLYILRSGHRVAFASEMKALGVFAEARGVRLTHSPLGIASYFTFGYAAHPHTIFNEITKVEPGTAVTVGLIDGNLSYERLPEPVADVPESFDEALEQSVTRHMVADVPVGLFLSGGFDSTALALALKKQGVPLRAFTLEIDGRKDAAYAKRVAEHAGLSHSVTRFTHERFEDVYRRLWDYVDDAVADTALFTNFAVAEDAARDVKVVLAGEGGDEMFFGYERYRVLQKMRRVKKMSGIFERLGLQGVAHTDLYISFLRPLVRRARLFEARVRGDLLGGYAEMAAIGGDVGDRKRILKTLRYFGQGSNPSRISHFDQAYYLPDDLLYKTDITTMAHSIEARVPFLDAGVEAYARATQKNYDGKKQLRDYLSASFPQELILKDKIGFSIPVRQYIYEYHRADVCEALDMLVRRNVPSVSLKALARMRDNPSYLEAVERSLPQFPFACLMLARILQQYKIH